MYDYKKYILKDLCQDTSEIEYIVANYIENLNIDNGPWIAGGAVRNILMGNPLNCSDIDIFNPDVETYNRTTLNIKGAITRTIDGMVEMSIIDRNMNKNYHIQSIYFKPHANIETLLNSFDFTVSQFATDGKYLITTEQALDDLTNKTIRYIKTGDFHLHKAYYRMAKYCSYGFTPTDETLRLAFGSLGENDYNCLNFKMMENYNMEKPITIDEAIKRMGLDNDF